MILVRGGRSAWGYNSVLVNEPLDGNDGPKSQYV